ncbi:MAG: hypothetical protein KAR42_17545 [candidate division Zixibacteria bacterium]|nr:hypothetical protein [candidate division Zixibacteria bacterium]
MDRSDKRKLDQLCKELVGIDSRRVQIIREINQLEREPEVPCQASKDTAKQICNASPATAKIRLFRSLFRGRQDVYPRRFESVKTGKSGYQPTCKNEWARGACEKPKVKCSNCSYREYLPVTDKVIEWHLRGNHYSKSEVRIYDYVDIKVPMLSKMFDRRLRGYKAIGYEMADNVQ